MLILKHSIFRLSLPVLTAVILAGCDNKGVRVYTAPKDIPYEPPAPHHAPHPDHPGHSEHEEAAGKVWRPALKYKLPEGWKDLGPDAANIARFAAGEVAVAITALASMKGNETGLVNMWRQVRGQDPLSDEEAMKTLTDADIGGATGKMFEFAETGAEKGRRFIVAFVHRPEGSLFFKIQGDDAGVTAQRAAFFAMLKSVEFTGGDAPVPAAKPEPEAKIKLPAGWTQVAPGAMQVAKFTVPEKDGGKADVAVSVFPGDTGGNAANIKRWRGQIGLPDVDDATAAASAKPIEGAPEGSVMVDLEHNGKAIIGAIIPRSGQYIFFKLMGDASAVTAAREAFVSFVKGTP